jgi:hypothetical protein
MNVVRKDGKPNSKNMNHSRTLMYQLMYLEEGLILKRALKE